MKRLVIKVGSSTLRDKNSICLNRLNNLVDFIFKLRSQKDYEVILVSSGAVSSGSTVLNLDRKDVLNRQVLSSIGQPLLLKEYEKSFSRYDIKCSQLLLVSDDFDSRKRCKNAKNVVEVLLSNSIVPIINENDVIANDELLFGDNDHLGAYSTYFFDANMLVVLSDIDGFYDFNPNHNKDAKVIKNVSFIDEKDLNIKSKIDSEFGTGGILTKLKAANFLMSKNRSMFLSSGFNLEYVYEFLINNNHINGTLFKKKS